MNGISQIDVCIIGAGAAGLMCAIEAGKRGRSVLILDKAKKPGSKILISGGGRCNFTNLHIDPEAYISNNPHFCKSALARYSQWDFIQLLEKHQLSWQEKTLGQLFCDQKAKAVLQLLVDECEQNQVKIRLDTEVLGIHKDSFFQLQTNHSDVICESLVIATGGPSIPRMGSTDYGLQVAKQFAIKNFPFRAGLVPFTFTQQQLQGFFKDLAGISLVVEVSCNNHSFKESMLFTHRGLSGPAMLQISSYWSKEDTLEVNLLADMDALSWLEEQQSAHPNTELKNLLTTILPKRLAYRLCETYFDNKPVKQFNNKELSEIADQLHCLRLQPSGTEGMRTAEVALGGVDTNELSSKTFQTNKVERLYFIGETIDVTGHLGGYNFQWAWASGWCAGQFV
jgi:predicted Rossmann fold flavoprotein